MGSLLLDEAPLQVQPSLAIAIGLNEAIALQQLHWVLQNPKMGKRADGRKYVHMSVSEWRVGHFPFWSDATIQRTFASLEGLGLVKSRDDLNTRSFDRTKWYGIDYDQVRAIEEKAQKDERVLEHSKMTNGHRKMKNASAQVERTIPESSSPENSPEISHTPVKSEKKPQLDLDFGVAYAEYEREFGPLDALEGDRFGDIWDTYPVPDAHEHAREVMKAKADHSNLTFYEKTVRSFVYDHYQKQGGDSERERLDSEARARGIQARRAQQSARAN